MKFLNVTILFVFLTTSFLGISQIGKNTVTFKVSKGFGKVNGYFEKGNYAIHLNNENAEIWGTVESISINTGNSKRDKDLQKKEWLNSSEFPEISMRSTSITQVNETSYTGIFKVSIKGTDKNIPIAFAVINNRFVADFSVNLKDFDIGGGVLNMIVGNNVDVRIDLPI